MLEDYRTSGQIYGADLDCGVWSRGGELSPAGKLEIVDVEKVKGLSNYYVCEDWMCSDPVSTMQCVGRPTSSGCSVRMAQSTPSTDATPSLMTCRIPWRSASPSRPVPSAQRTESSHACQVIFSPFHHDQPCGVGLASTPSQRQ